MYSFVFIFRTSLHFKKKYGVRVSFYEARIFAWKLPNFGIFRVSMTDIRISQLKNKETDWRIWLIKKHGRTPTSIRMPVAISKTLYTLYILYNLCALYTVYTLCILYILSTLSTLSMLCTLYATYTFNCVYYMTSLLQIMNHLLQ